MADDEYTEMSVPQPPIDFTPEMLEQPRLSFGSAAADYNTFRPSYPAAAVKWAIGDKPMRVLEIGAGTGLMTQLLLDLGHHVTAIEPDDGMREQLAQLNHPKLTVLSGAAEDLPLKEAAVDAIAVAQAFHWFKLPEALPEMHRVLDVDGRLAVVWNRRNDDVDWVDQMSRIVGRHDARSGNRDTSLDDLTPYFDGIEGQIFDNPVRCTAESLVGLVDTYSYVRLSPDREQVLAAIRHLATTHPAIADQETFVLPTETVTYRARRSVL